METNLIVIHEKDHSTNKDTVIAVCDSLEKAEKCIEEYYGEGNYKELSFQDIRDSSLENSRKLRLKTDIEEYMVTIVLEWFELNNI